MQKANDGMNALKGNHGSGEAFTIKENKGKTDAEVLGTNIEVHDLKAKQKELEKTKSFNFFSSLGEKVSILISAICQGIVAFISAILSQIFGSLS